MSCRSHRSHQSPGKCPSLPQGPESSSSEARLDAAAPGAGLEIHSASLPAIFCLGTMTGPEGVVPTPSILHFPGAGFSSSRASR